MVSLTGGLNRSSNQSVARKGDAFCTQAKRERGGTPNGSSRILNEATSMRLHRCNERGCRELIPLGWRYCTKHYTQRVDDYHKRQEQHDNDPQYQAMVERHSQHNQQQYDQTVRHGDHEEQTQFYHSPQWQTVRDYVYARDMATCQVCGNVVTDRKIVDHIHPLRLKPDEKLVTANLWVLCYRCHSIKTKLEQQMNANMLKHLSRNDWTKYIKERI